MMEDIPYAKTLYYHNCRVSDDCTFRSDFCQE